MSTLPLKFLLVLFFQFFMSQSSNIEILPKVKEMVRDSCKQTRNYNQCVDALENDTSIRYDDQVSFTKRILEVTMATANELHRESNSWKQKSGLEEKMIQALETCSSEYGEALDGLKQAIQAMDSKDYKTAYSYAGRAINAADGCTQEFEESQQKMPFAENNEVLNQMATVAVDLISLF
ncbi:pectinesterase inhibitor-like [Magnolia sinica]|uniref:pectinesterase inhibitor-like n=1 Tax=Magnolia sinica TaxID=86752 RepID=UPI0026584FCD|nr:pectinesterase inhibitor-like [Magnolia sinica]